MGKDNREARLEEFREEINSFIRGYAKPFEGGQPLLTSVKRIIAMRALIRSVEKTLSLDDREFIERILSNIEIEAIGMVAPKNAGVDEKDLR